MEECNYATHLHNMAPIRNILHRMIYCCNVHTVVIGSLLIRLGSPRTKSNRELLIIVGNQIYLLM